MKPTVSVVMATHNYARYLPAAVESVLQQTLADWELIVIDDGSTDNTASVIKPYLDDSRIRYVRINQLGQTRAKNLGARLANADRIAFLDADDVWLPQKLAKQMAVLDQSPSVGVVFTRRCLIDDAGNERPASDPQPPRGRVLPEIFLRNFVCFSSVLVRRELLERVGGFDPEWDLSIDYDLWLRIAPLAEFDYVDEVLVRYRTGHGNLSRKLADRVAIATAIMNRTVGRCPLPDGVVAEGYASTFRSMGYVLRGTEPIESIRWYLRAIRWPSGRLLSCKGLIASILISLLRRPALSTPENLRANR